MNHSNLCRSVVAAILAVVAITFMATAGPEYVEPGDAGPLPGSADQASGPGEQLASIKGRLGAVADTPTVAGTPDDFQDMYLICISDPENFMATCAEFFGGETVDFDSRMYLFDINGFGVLGNDDTLIITANAGGGPIIQTGSTFGNMTNDGSGAAVLEAGLYYLAITFAPFSPTAGGELIFDPENPTDVFGPTGPGGNMPVGGWQEVEGACGVFDEGGCTCFDLSAEDCAEQDGDFAGAGLLCETNDPCPPVGACLPKGICDACFISTEAECSDIGLYLGDDSACPDCEITGACFVDFDGGTGCFVTQEPICTASGGVYQGDGTTCVVPTGACFLTALVGPGCVQLTEAECEATLGIYQGDDTTCPTGACFVGKEGCFEVTFEECDALEGFYDGDDTLCNPPIGACFFGDGVAGGLPPSCLLLTEADCLDAEGSYGGDGTTCPTGACFFGAVAGGGLCAVLTEEACFNQGGFYQGDGTMCPAFGACVFNLGKTSSCFETTEDDCGSSEGNWLGPDTVCTGACFIDGSCFLAGDQFDCDVSGGTFDGYGTVCPESAGDGPPLPGDYTILLTGACFADTVPTGACVLSDGSCDITDEFDCVNNLGGIYLGDDAPCPDTTAPELSCSASPVTPEDMDDDDDDGSSDESDSSSNEDGDPQWSLAWDASDDSGEVFVSAVVEIGCATIEIASGQLIDVVCYPDWYTPYDDDSSSSDCDHGSEFGDDGCFGTCDFYFDVYGVLHTRSDETVLIVTATDAAGNASICEIDLCGLDDDGGQGDGDSDSGSGSDDDSSSSADDGEDEDFDLRRAMRMRPAGSASGDPRR